MQKVLQDTKIRATRYYDIGQISYHCVSSFLDFKILVKLHRFKNNLAEFAKPDFRIFVATLHLNVSDFL